MKRIARVGIVCSATAALVLAGAGVGSAGSVSSNGLTLTVKDSPFFVKGTQGTLIHYCDPYAPNEGATLRQSITATSPYGIANWDIADIWPEGSYAWTHYAQSAAPVLQFQADNYEGDCGGGQGGIEGHDVLVTDNHGNQVEMAENFNAIQVTRWDGSNMEYNDVGTWSYSGTWKVQSPCPSCDNGSQTYSTTANASATFLLNSNSFYGAPSGHLGLMLTQGPGHGKAALYLDGKKVGTIDTLASKTKYRMYVWDFGPLTPTGHIIKVVNLGTAGRSRIDLNAISFVRGTTWVSGCTPTTC